MPTLHRGESPVLECTGKATRGLPQEAPHPPPAQTLNACGPWLLSLPSQLSSVHSIRRSRRRGGLLPSVERNLLLLEVAAVLLVHQNQIQEVAYAEPVGTRCQSRKLLIDDSA